MNKYYLLCLLMTVLLHTHPVTAIENSNLYLGFNFGQSYLQPDTAGTIYSISDSNDSGFKVYAGYRFDREFAVEAYYADLGKVSLSPTGSIAYQDLGITGMYYFYLAEKDDEKLSAFLRAGAGHMRNQADVNYIRENDTHLMLGAGIDYELQKNLSLRVDLDMYDYDAHLLSVGLVYRFGESAPQPVVTEAVTEAVPVPEPQPESIPVENPDQDSDGVTNENDQCPDTPPGQKVDAQGCELKNLVVLEGVSFASDSDQLLDSSNTALDKLFSTLQRYPDLKVEISGHTDSLGSNEYNRVLSERRAIAVRDYLVNKGLNPDTLTAKGYGEDMPVADNATAEGRSRNRRVEVKFSDQD